MSISMTSDRSMAMKRGLSTISGPWNTSHTSRRRSLPFEIPLTKLGMPQVWNQSVNTARIPSPASQAGFAPLRIIHLLRSIPKALRITQNFHLAFLQLSCDARCPGYAGFWVVRADQLYIQIGHPNFAITRFLSRTWSSG